MADVVYAKSNTSVTNEHGVIYQLKGGEAWDADDPLVHQHPNMFTPSPVKARTSQGWIETATAEPGKKRKSGRGA